MLYKQTCKILVQEMGPEGNTACGRTMSTDARPSHKNKVNSSQRGTYDPYAYMYCESRTWAKSTANW